MITVCPVSSSSAKARQYRQEQAPLELPREVPRLGCHDCEGRADALELILRGLKGWASVLSVWFGIGKASGCGSIG